MRSMLIFLDSVETDECPDTSGVASSVAQELAAFQDFNRREVMRTVKDRILPVIGAEIKERLGASLTEIIDASHSTNVIKYLQTRNETSQAAESTNALRETFALQTIEPAQTSFTRPLTSSSERQLEQGTLNTNDYTIPAAFGQNFNPKLPTITPDSGYNSGFDLCECSCHWSTELG